MQPDNMQSQPAMAPMQSAAPQPNAPIPPQPMPIGYQQAPTPPTPKKKSNISPVLAIFFALLSLILGILLIFNLTKKTPENATVGDITIPISTPLSKVKIPEGSPKDILKDVLAGRTFAINSSYDEYITFVNDSKYEYSYYREPFADRQKLQPSTEPGTYKVDGDTITLSNEETFQIKGDYLIKTSQKISNNNTAVYFDSLQLHTIIQNISVAFSNYLNTTKKVEMPNYEKIRIDRYYCHADFSVKKMTNADSYLCDTSYSYLLDQTKIEAQMKAEKATSFANYCTLANSPYRIFLTEGGNCNNDETVSTWTYMIVRTDNISYQITGTFRAIEGTTEPLARY